MNIVDPQRIGLLAIVLLALGAAAACADTPATFPRSAFAAAKDVPVYCQEWHIWWGFPYPDQTRPMSHMSPRLVADGEPWRLHWDRNGYPYVGLYDSANADIIRWQARCMKNAGITSAAIMIHPEWDEGLVYLQEHRDKLRGFLDIAAEEGFPVFFMDEVAFRNGSIAQDPDVMARRVIRFLGLYKDHPGFLRIDGKPVFYYQTWGYWVGVEKTRAMMDRVEAAVGPVYWMVFGDVNEVSQVPNVDAIISSASNHRRDARTRRYRDTQPLIDRIKVGRARQKAVGDLIYPRFDGTGQPWRTRSVALPGRGGVTFVEEVERQMEFRPDFLMLSSWNDWEEGANFEPGWDFDGFTGDPFLYCNAIAFVRGLAFTPPPNPPKQAVHPTIWEKLGHGDGAGPIIDEVRRAHVRGGSIEVVVRDTVTPVDALEVVWNGDAYWRAAQPGETDDSGSLTLAGGTLHDARAVGTPLGPFETGAARAGSSTLQWTVRGHDAATLGDRPHVGVAWVFDRASPRAGVTLQVPTRDAVTLAEPPGSSRRTLTIPLAPHNRAGDIERAVWDGWQTGVALTARPVALGEAPGEVSIETSGRSLGLVALLGPPQPDRITRVAPEKDDPSGLRVRYRLLLPDDVVLTPGAHFLWLRARDAAGNWGSPTLVVLPNYEQPWPDLAAPLAPETLDAPGAVLADPMTDNRLWTPDRNDSVRNYLDEQITARRMVELGNGVSYRQLDTPVTGSFTLAFDVIHTSYQRGFMAFVTDAAGRKGYGLVWDSAGSDQYDGTGRVALLKLDADQPLSWGVQPKPLTESTSSGHVATQPPLARVRLHRDGGTGELTLRVDGEERCRAVDRDFSTFGRVYLRGNDHQLVDNLVLTPR